MEIARLYRDAQTSFVELARTLTDDDWAAPSPCTPGWTVRDVLSHVAGVTVDIVEGNVEGAATDPWTAAQVERWRDTPVDDLLARWDDAIDQAATAIEALGERRPVFDCHAHEHDVRHAVGRPGNRTSDVMMWISDQFVQAGLSRRLRYEFADGTVAISPGAGAPIELRGVTRFDVFRSRLGRRSVAQVRSWAWSERPDDRLLDEWFVFGPAVDDVAEEESSGMRSSD